MNQEFINKHNLKRWSKDSNLYLIPESLYDQLDHLFSGMEVTDILGGTKIVGPEYKNSKGTQYIDGDDRFGLLAYGFKINL